MEHIIGEYYECNGEIFRKLKLREGKCQIRTPEGKYMWVRPSDNTTFITKPTLPKPSDNITACDKSDNITKPEAEVPSDKCDNTTSTTSSDNITGSCIITGSDITTSITGDNITPEPEEDDESYGTFAEIERPRPHTPIRNMNEEEDKIYEPDENGFIW